MRTLLLALVAVATPVFAGEMVSAQIPADAKWFLHADLDAMRGSETGKHVFAHIEDKHGARFRAFKRMFSLHPLTDLRGVTLFGDGKPEHAVALIAGTFDRAHMEDVVKAADGYTESAHSGFTVHQWQDKGSKQHAAFASASLLVFSRQQELLHDALDVLKANAPAAADPFFAAEGGKPLLAACARLSEIEMPADAARLVRMARTLRLAANENSGRFSVRAHAETGDAKDADRLRRMLDGVIAFAQAGDAKLDGLDLRADLALNADSPGLGAALSLPVGEWLKLMEMAAAEEAKKKQDR